MTVQIEQGPRVREGSPWTGLWAVVGKDMADHLTSVRMQIMEALVLVTAVVTVYVGLQSLRQTVGQDPFIFLRLFTSAREPFPAFVGFLGLLVPPLAIALAFDAINGEFNGRTMSRVLAQPIYRDALLMGKFLAGFFTLALVLTAIWLLIIGIGILGLGLPPSGEEVARLMIFLLATIFFGGIWLAVALLFSIIFRQPATAALAAIATWLALLIFWGIVVSIVANVVQPVRYGLPQELLAQDHLAGILNRLSPNTLFSEVTLALLRPEKRAFGIMELVLRYTEGAIIGTPLPLSQSLLLIWPQLTGLVAGMILLVALGYVLFQRQEIRA